jgi:lipooligosaccharide transport system permease protein
MTPIYDIPAWRRWYPVWSRNFRVWRKLLGAAVLGNIGEPLLYLFAMGYGLGSFVGDMEGVSYMSYLAAGMVCASTMTTASFEGMYSAYTRMAVQGTWAAMLSTPLALRDILVGEVVWAGTKGLFSAIAIVFIAILFGLVADWRVIVVLPIAGLLGMCFAAMALMITAVARSYDFFLYYFTLLVTPMLLLSGVFFPITGMPEAIQIGAKFLPLYHAIALIRPLMLGQIPTGIILHLLVLCLYIAVSLPVANHLIRRRLIS